MSAGRVSPDRTGPGSTGLHRTDLGPAAPAPMGQERRADADRPNERWVGLIQGVDRPGTLTAVTSVFSTRGVSFASLATGSVDGDAGIIAVSFVATERRQHLLARTVARLAAVRSVEMRSADDRSVRAAGVVRMPDGVPFAPSGDTEVRWAGDTTAGQPVLVEGSFADVTAIVSEAQSRGAVTTAVVILGF